MYDNFNLIYPIFIWPITPRSKKFDGRVLQDNLFSYGHL